MQFLYKKKSFSVRYISKTNKKIQHPPPISYLSHMEKQGKERQRNFKIPAQIQSRIIQHNILLHYFEFSRFVFSQHV